MKQVESLREFADKLGGIFADSMFKVMVKEEKEPGYLNRKEFMSCRDRAAAGVMDAAVPVIDTLGLAIAVSYEVKDGEDTTGEQVDLLGAEADAEVGTRGWWSH